MDCVGRVAKLSYRHFLFGVRHNIVFPASGFMRQKSTLIPFKYSTLKMCRVAVAILFISCLEAEIRVLPVFVTAIFNFPLPGLLFDVGVAFFDTPGPENEAVGMPLECCV